MTVTPPPSPSPPDPASGSVPRPGARAPAAGSAAAGDTAPVGAAPAVAAGTARGAIGVPPLPDLLSKLAGSAYAHACEGADLDQLYRDLATGLFSPDPGSGSPPLPAPCASLLVPPDAGGLAQTLLSRVDPPSDLSGPALVQLFTSLSTLQTHLLGKYGAFGLAERIDQTAASLSLASHWITCLARAVLSLDSRLRESERLRGSASHPDIHAKLDAATREADDLRRQLRAASDAEEEHSFERTRLELHKAELTRFLTITMEANRDSVGTPDEVADFLASKAGFPACDRDTVLRVMDACRRRDATGLSGVHFSVLPLPGSAPPPLPPVDDSPVILPVLSEPPVPPAIRSRRSGSGAGLVLAEPGSTTGTPLARLVSAPCPAAAGSGSAGPAPASSSAGSAGSLLVPGAGGSHPDDAGEDDSVLRDLGDDGDTVMSDGGASDGGREVSPGSKRSRPAPPDRPKGKRLHTDGAGTPGAGSASAAPGSPGFEIVSPPSDDGSVVPTHSTEPTSTLAGSPMVVCSVGVRFQPMPVAPRDVAATVVGLRYAWLRQTPSYRHDLPVMARLPVGQPAAKVRLANDTERETWNQMGPRPKTALRHAFNQLFEFRCVISRLVFPDVAQMGYNPVLKFGPSFDEPIVVPLVRPEMNGYRLQRDSKGFKPDPVTKIFPSVYDTSYILAHSAGPDGSGVKLQDLCGPVPDPYLRLLESRPWDAMWENRCTWLYMLDPTTLDTACQVWLVRYIAYMYHHRQAMWEHHHWLHTEKNAQDSSPGWKQVLARRGMLANYFTSATRVMFSLLPKSWPAAYDELLKSEPALWVRRPMHSTWAPSHTALFHPDSPVSLAEQARTLDTEEPFRLCYAGFGERFVETLRPVGQIALRYHHYVGVAWRLPSLLCDRPWATAGSSLGTPGPDFYTDKYSAGALREWRDAIALIMAADRSGGRIREDEARHILLNRWEPGSGFLHEAGLLVTPAMELGRLPTLPLELRSTASEAGAGAATSRPGPGETHIGSDDDAAGADDKEGAGDGVEDEYDPEDFESEEDDAGDADWKPSKKAGGVRLARRSVPPSESKSAGPAPGRGTTATLACMLTWIISRSFLHFLVFVPSLSLCRSSIPG